MEDLAPRALGGDDLLDAEGPARLDVPRHFPLQLAAMLRRQLAARLGEAQGAQDVERPLRLRKVETRLLHLGAHIGERRRRRAHRAAHDGIHRRDPAQVRGERHPPRRGGLGRGAREGGARRLQRQRVAGMAPGHGVEHQRRIGYVARHRAVNREVAERRAGRPVRDAARTRAQPHHAAETRGVAQRAAEVAAGREPYLPRRQRRRRSAGRSAGGQVRPPRVAGGAEHRVEGLRSGAELRRVRLADDDRAVRLQPLDHVIRARRDVVGVDRRAEGRAHALHLVQVLHRDRQAGEPVRRRVGGGRGRNPPRPVARPVEAERRHGAERAVGFGDPLRRRVDQLQRRDFAPAQRGDGRARRKPA